MGPRLFVGPRDNGASLGAGIRHEDLCGRAAGGQSLAAPPGGSCGPNPSASPQPGADTDRPGPKWRRGCRCSPWRRREDGEEEEAAGRGGSGPAFRA